MKIFEALVSELKRLESVSDEQWNEEMSRNSDLGILIFAAKAELEEIAYGSLRVPVFGNDVANKTKVDAIIQKVLPQ